MHVAAGVNDLSSRPCGSRSVPRAVGRSTADLLSQCTVSDPEPRNVTNQQRYTSWRQFVTFLDAQLVKKFPAFYGTRRFITVFTTARHWSLPWARCTQSTPSHSVSLRSSLILSSHLCLCVPSGLIPSGFRQKFYVHFSRLPCVLHDPSISSFLTLSL
jgi:hypothetical protein